MTAHPASKQALLDQISSWLTRPVRPLLVAVDGADGVGKTRFADDLADTLAGNGTEVVRASVDGFHHPRDHRHAQGRNGETVWRRTFDYRRLRTELIDPWRRGSGRTFRTAWFDHRSDAEAPTEPRPVPEHGVLIVDGVFVQRPELVHAWDLVVYLDAPAAVGVARMAARDGLPNDPEDPGHRRYLDAQQIYRAQADPSGNADLVVDYTDFDQPRWGRDPGDDSAPPPGWREDGDRWVREVTVARGDVLGARLLDDAADRAGRPPS